MSVVKFGFALRAFMNRQKSARVPRAQPAPNPGVTPRPAAKSCAVEVRQLHLEEGRAALLLHGAVVRPSTAQLWRRGAA